MPLPLFGGRTGSKRHVRVPSFMRKSTTSSPTTPSSATFDAAITNGVNGRSNGINGHSTPAPLTNGASHVPVNGEEPPEPSLTNPDGNTGEDHLTLPEQWIQGAAAIRSLIKTINDPNVNADVEPTDPRALKAGLKADIASQSNRLGANVELIMEFIEAAKNKGLIDDKTYTMEDLIQLVASLPSDSANAAALTQQFIKSLWDNLSHPPLSYLGDEWKYRQADGSNNNRMYPHLGKAGSPYARSVKPSVQLTPVLPDPGLVFDELMARDGKARTHPTEMSSQLFYLASIIIHDIFRTDSHDPTRVLSSSYLDLSPLYGHCETEQMRVRTLEDGLLKPDAFSEIRLLGFPPGVIALLISFNRYHNWVAGQLKMINEGGRFTLRTRLTPHELEKYKTPERKLDNDLFQTARLITCGLYVNIILVDYVRAILNLQRTHSEWSLDPRANYGEVFGPTGLPEGVGNQVSVEFNLIYRWHSAISDKDEEWTCDFFKQAVPDKDPAECTVDELGMAFAKFLGPLAKKDPGELEFGGLKRQPGGKFKDEDLVNILTSSTDDIAASFGARNVPKVLRAVEMLGIQQARQWNVATLNEVRKYFGLQPHKTFGDISSDPSVQNSLEMLYGDPDHVEFYPGIVAEDGKEGMKPGSGLCPGFTISKAVLSDAVALVRGDRFYTADFDARTLTNWGFTEVSPDKQIVGGGVFYKLLMRAYPGWYKGNSVYALLPFNPAAVNRKTMKELGSEYNYDYSQPSFTPSPKEIVTVKAIRQILGDPSRFGVPWGPHTYALTRHDYMLSGDTVKEVNQHKTIEATLYSPPRWAGEIQDLYYRVTSDMIKQYAKKTRKGYQIDVIADVANLSHAVAVGKLFHIPLKLKEHPRGLITARQFHTVMSVLFAYVFLDVDPASDLKLKLGAFAAADAMSKVVEASVKMCQDSFWDLKSKGLAHYLDIDDITKSFGTQLIKRLAKACDNDVDKTVAAIIPTIAGAVPTQAQGLSQILDLFFSDEYIHHWPEIQRLARSNDPKDHHDLVMYGLEGMRLATPAFGLFRKVKEDVVIQDGDNTVTFNKGDVALVNFIKGGLDETVFPEPRKIKLDRPLNSYIHQGFGTHECIGRGLTLESIATQLKVLGRLKGLRRVKGQQGQLKTLPAGPFKAYMKPDWSSLWPFPTTMKFEFDEFEE